MINKVILVGRVGKNPDIRTLDGGAKVATFSLATTERAYKLKNGTQVPEQTEWHNIVIWNGLAEVAEKYVHSGDCLYIEGKIKTRSYEKDGQKRYVTEIFGDKMHMISTKSHAQQSPQGYQPSPVQQPVQQPTHQQDMFPPDVDENGNELPF